MLLKVHATIFRKRDAFTAKSLLHYVRSLEVEPAAERTKTVYYAVARQRGAGGGIHRPSHRPGRASRAQILGDVAVGRDAARGNLRNDIPDAVEKVGFGGHARAAMTLSVRCQVVPSNRSCEQQCPRRKVRVSNFKMAAV